MILGYEQPVDIPVMSIYDKQAIRDYVGAVQKDYEEGVKAFNDFRDKYGALVSSMPGASDAYYNAGMKRVMDEYNAMIAQGIDPIRSIEGRSRLARAERMADIPTMSKIAATSQNYDEWLKNKAKLESQGLYDPKLNEWYLKQNGLDPNNFDFKNQSWDVTSPLQKATIQDILAPTIEDLAKRGYDYDKEKSKNNPGYRVYTVTQDRMVDALNKNVDDLMKDPRMQYIQQSSGMNDDQFRQVLLGHMQSELQPKYELDKLYLTQLELAAKARQAAADRALKRSLKQPQPPVKNPQFTDLVVMNTQNRYFDVVTRNMQNRFANYMKHMSNMDPKNKKKWTQYQKEWENYNNLTPSQQQAFLQKYGYIDRNGSPTQKFYDWSERTMSVGAGSTKYATTKNGRRVGTIDRNSAINRAKNIYNMYTTQVVGQDAAMLSDYIAGGQKNASGRYYKITFGNGTDYTRAAQLRFAGVTERTKTATGRNTKDGDFIFSQFLQANNISGNVFHSQNMRSGRLPGNNLVITGMGVSVKKSDIQKFLDDAKNNHYMIGNHYVTSNTSDDKILSWLGCSQVLRDGTPVKNTKTTSSNKDVAEKTSESYTKDNVYVVIPTTHTISSEGVNLTTVNDQYNKWMGGSKYAAGEHQSAIESAYQFSKGQ